MIRARVPAIAMIHLGLGNDGALFEWLDRCVGERDAMLPWLKFMPCFDRVTAAPEIPGLLAQIGLS